MSKTTKTIAAKERHRKLRGELTGMGWEQAELADALNISPTSVSNRMRGKYSWSISEAWTVMALLGIRDPAKLGELFPPMGLPLED